MYICGTNNYCSFAVIFKEITLLLMMTTISALSGTLHAGHVLFWEYKGASIHHELIFLAQRQQVL